MTVSHIIVILSACDFIDNLKIIEINVEPPVQSIKVREFIEETLGKLDVGNEDMRELEKIRGEVWKREKRKHLKKKF